jgi:hypothetical protein
MRARREAEALRSEADQLVGRLFEKEREPSGVVRTMQADQALSASLRREAQRVIWRRMAAPE